MYFRVVLGIPLPDAQVICTFDFKAERDLNFFLRKHSRTHKILFALILL